MSSRALLSGTSRFTRGGNKLNSKSSSSFRKRHSRRRIAGLAAIVVLVLVILLALSRLAGSDEIYGGVRAGGVDLGGMKPAEARAAFAKQEGSLPQTIKVSGPGGQNFAIRNPGARLDPAATVKRAYAVGREGWFGKRISQRLDAAFGGMSVDPALDYQPEKLQSEVASLAGQVDEPMSDASVTMSGTQVVLKKSSEGYKLDVAATTNNVEQALRNKSGKAEMAGKVSKPEVTTQEAQKAADQARKAVSEPVTLKGGTHELTIAPTVLADGIVFSRGGGTIHAALDRAAFETYLSNQLSGFEIPPVDASYRLENGKVEVVPGKNGKTIDKDKLLEEMQNGVFKGVHEYEMPGTTSSVKPKLTTEEARKLKPTKLLGDYRTNYEIVPGDTRTRNQNLRIASAGVSGTTVAPGAIYSMNDTVSHLNYKAALVIDQGKETTTEGGGLCQVTSTLYDAAMLAGMESIERHQHYSMLPYIRPGMDATVWFGSGGGTELDMKFKNTSPGYLLLNEYVSKDGYIYAQVYGRPTGKKVKMWSKVTYFNDHQAGWNTYKKVTKDGKVIQNGKMYNSVYESLTDPNGKEIKVTDVHIAKSDP